MRRIIQKLNKGDIITADLLRGLAEVAQKTDNRPISTGGPGVDFGNFSAALPYVPKSMCVVRMLSDAVPAQLAEANTVVSQGYGGISDLPGNGNAVVQIWDDSMGAWTDNMDVEITVTPMGNLPVLEGDILRVWFDEIAQCWFPALTTEVAVVRISNNVPNGAGLMEGFIQVLDPLALTYSDGESCWVKDANS
jgi:hypothetical protein